VRAVWLETVVAAVQRIAGQSQIVDLDGVHDMLTTFVRSLPEPASMVERLILRAQLLDVAWRCGHTIHARAHRGDARTCSFVPTTCLDRFWSAPVLDPRKAFFAWARAFSTEFSRVHPPSVASRVGRLIRDAYHRRWDLTTLGHRFHVTPSQLRRGFEREFGMSVHDYQQRVRVKAAIGQVKHGNIEATALEVGYKAKKNFYHAFRQVTGVTPTAFRRLSQERALHVIESIDAPPRRGRIVA
jgi:AraC-like DNA-binding protein